MEVPNKMNPLAWLRKHLDDEGGNDVIREMVKAFAEQLMSAEAVALCGAGWGERTPERTNRRNGYRERTFDTRAGTIELDIPKLRAGSYFPDWFSSPAAVRSGPSRLVGQTGTAPPPARAVGGPGPVRRAIAPAHGARASSRATGRGW